MSRGGYVLISRRLLTSGIMKKPPLYLKLWIWMLMQASHKDHGDLKRGQFFTTIEKMQTATTYKAGYRTIRPSRKQIRAAYDFLTKGTMIVTTKVTRGLLITILNYDYYQNPKNYEGHNEGHNEKSTRGTLLTRRDTRRIFYVEIVGYLNQKTRKKFKSTSKATQRLIEARLNEGFTLEDFKTVINNKCQSWLTDKNMNGYLRPQTLFGTKFEAYLNEQHRHKPRYAT